MRAKEEGWDYASSTLRLYVATQTDVSNAVRVYLGHRTQVYPQRRQSSLTSAEVSGVVDKPRLASNVQSRVFGVYATCGGRREGTRDT